MRKQLPTPTSKAQMLLEMSSHADIEVSKTIASSAEQATGATTVYAMTQGTDDEDDGEVKFKVYQEGQMPKAQEPCYTDRVYDQCSGCSFLRNVTLEECQSICLQLGARCEGFTWFSARGGCRLAPSGTSMKNVTWSVVTGSPTCQVQYTSISTTTTTSTTDASATACDPTYHCQLTGANLVDQTRGGAATYCCNHATNSVCEGDPCCRGDNCASNICCGPDGVDLSESNPGSGTCIAGHMH